MASVFTVHEAKTHLSKLIARALDGEEVVIARGNEPKVQLVPIEEKSVRPAPKRQPGTLKGLVSVPDSFFEPLPEEELRRWEGRGD